MGGCEALALVYFLRFILGEIAEAKCCSFFFVIRCCIFSSLWHLEQRQKRFQVVSPQEDRRHCWLRVSGRTFGSRGGEFLGGVEALWSPRFCSVCVKDDQSATVSNAATRSTFPRRQSLIWGVTNHSEETRVVNESSFTLVVYKYYNKNTLLHGWRWSDFFFLLWMDFQDFSLKQNQKWRMSGACVCVCVRVRDLGCVFEWVGVLEVCLWLTEQSAWVCVWKWDSL